VAQNQSGYYFTISNSTITNLTIPNNGYL